MPYIEVMAKMNNYNPRFMWVALFIHAFTSMLNGGFQQAEKY